MMYELVIIGGGPAGIAAGVYAARKKMKTLLIADSFGGQSLVSAGIENWIGTKMITGYELGKNLEEHLRHFQKDIDIWDGNLVSRVEKIDGGFRLTTNKNQMADTKTVLVCSGSRRRRLGVPGEDRLDGKGLAWCSICDAPFFKDKVVAVIGGGNAGLEAVIDLKPYANKIYIIQRSDKLRGDPVTQEKVLAMPNLTVIYNALTQEILGDNFVSGIRYKDAISGEEKTLEVGGVFVEVGSLPNIDFIKDLVKIDDYGQIVTDARTQKTSLEGIWAAGDVTDVLYKQNNISVGDAIRGVLNVFDYLHKK